MASSSSRDFPHLFRSLLTSLSKNRICITCLGVLTAYLHHHVHAWRPQSSDSVRALGNGIAKSCELPCESWESNLGPLEVQAVLLTTEPSLLPTADFFNTTLEE